MSWRPLSSLGGRETAVRFEPDGTAVFRTTQDCEAVVERNIALQNDADRGWLPGGDMRRVASIPMGVVMQWMQEGVDLFSGEQQDEIARRLNSSEWAFLRTAPGHLGPVGDGTYR
jgi:hypothetical protein